MDGTLLMLYREYFGLIWGPFTRQREDLHYADCIPNMAAAGSPHLPRTYSAPALSPTQFMGWSLNRRLQTPSNPKDPCCCILGSAAVAPVTDRVHLLFNVGDMCVVFK